MKKVQHQSSTPVASNDQPFEFNPITLVSLLNSEQYFEIAWRAYIQGELFFMSGSAEEHKDLIQKAFKAMYSTADFQALNEETQNQQMNMGVQLLILLDYVKELNDSTNDRIIECVNAKYTQITQS